jgi:hypothetical protein
VLLATAAALLAGATALAGAAALAGALELAVALALLAPVGEAAVLAKADELLDALVPQAVIALARPTSPTPASTPRRVASPSACGSCVTSAPHGVWLLVRK